jgi:hypothetical protein
MCFPANLQPVQNCPQGRTGYRGVLACRGGFRSQLWYKVRPQSMEVNERAGMSSRLACVHMHVYIRVFVFISQQYVFITYQTTVGIPYLMALPSACTPGAALDHDGACRHTKMKPISCVCGSSVDVNVRR